MPGMGICNKHLRLLCSCRLRTITHFTLMLGTVTVADAVPWTNHPTLIGGTKAHLLKLRESDFALQFLVLLHPRYGTIIRRALW